MGLASLRAPVPDAFQGDQFKTGGGNREIVKSGILAQSQAVRMGSPASAVTRFG